MDRIFKFQVDEISELYYVGKKWCFFKKKRSQITNQKGSTFSVL